MTGLMRIAAACLVCLLVAACAGTPTKPRDTTLSTMEKKIDALAEWAGSHNKVPDAAATKALTFRSASTRTWARIADGDVKLSELLSKGRRHFAHRGALIGYFPNGSEGRRQCKTVQPRRAQWRSVRTAVCSAGRLGSAPVSRNEGRHA